MKWSDPIFCGGFIMDNEAESGFDPYLRWLGIRDKQRPPNHYRLLGLELFEDDADVISTAADRQMAHVRTYQAGARAAESQKLLNELALARVCLLCPEEKTNYDRQLKSGSLPPASTRDSADLELAPLDDSGQIDSPIRSDSVSPQQARPVKKSPSLRPTAQEVPRPAAVRPRPVASLIDEDEILLADSDSALTDPSKTDQAGSLMLGPRQRTSPWGQPVVWIAIASAGLVLLMALVAAVAMRGKPAAEVVRSSDDVPAVEQAPRGVSPPPAAGPANTVKPLDTGKLPDVDRPEPAGTEPSGSLPDAGEPANPLAGSGSAGGDLPPEPSSAGNPTEPAKPPPDSSSPRVEESPTPTGQPDDSSPPEASDPATPAAAVDSSDAWDLSDPWRSPQPTHPRTPQSSEGLPEPLDAAGPDEVPASSNGEKRPVPDLQQQNKLRTEIKNLFADDYGARDPRRKIALAKELLEQGRATSDGAARYVLLSEACEVAQQCEEIPTCLKALEEIVEGYQVDAIEQAVDVMGNLSRKRLDAEAGETLIAYTLDVAWQGVMDEDFRHASRLLGCAQTMLRYTRVPELVRYVNTAREEITYLRLEYDRVEQARVQLETEPDDPQANLVVARYLCLAKGRFDEALPYFDKGGGGDLAELARLEAGKPSDTRDVLRLADGWWTVAAGAKDPVSRWSRMRAAGWYERALPQLGGLAKDKAEQRLGETQQLAEAAGMFRWGKALQQAIEGRWRVEWQTVGGTSRISAASVEYLDFARNNATYGRSGSPVGPVTPIGTWEVRGSEVVAEHSSNYIDRFQMVAPDQISAVRLRGGQLQMRGLGSRSGDLP